VRQLEPGARERVRELVRVLEEAARDLFVGRVEAQRQVGGQHPRRVLLALVEGVRDDRRRVLGDPLLGARRALLELVLEAEQVLEEAVAELRRRLRPGDLGAARDRVAADAGLVLALPAEALVLERPRLRLRPDERGVARAVRLAEAVAARDQRDGLLVVHRHAAEGLADVDRGLARVGLAVRAFRVHVDEAHLHGAERLRELALAAVALIAEPAALGTPVELFRLPDVGAAAGEAEGLEAHRFERDVAREHEQVRPGNLAAVLLLDRPEEPARLVEVRVVRPAVEGREALLPGARAAAAIRDAVSAGGVPGEADHQPAVMPEVGRPPVLRVRHQGPEVLDHGVEVQALELLRVVEVAAHRVRLLGVPVQPVDVEGRRPPVAVPPRPLAV
jgi:hypothetical protein